MPSWFFIVLIAGLSSMGGLLNNHGYAAANPASKFVFPLDDTDIVQVSGKTSSGAEDGAKSWIRSTIVARKANHSEDDPQIAYASPSFEALQFEERLKDKDHHWSALENYYGSLGRIINGPSAGDKDKPDLNQQIITRLVEQSHPTYKQPSDYYSTGLYNNLESPVSGYKTLSDYLDAMLKLRKLQQQNQQQQQQQYPLTSHGPFLLPTLKGSGHDDQASNNYAPGLSRISSAGGGQLPAGSYVSSGIAKVQPQYSGLPQQDQVQRDKLLQMQLSRILQQQLDQQQLHQLANRKYQEPQVSVIDGHVKYLEWLKLSELLKELQQQERTKHQLKSFGSVYDQLRSADLARDLELGEKSYCGPRNFVNLFVPLPSSAGGNKLDDLKYSISPFDPVMWSRVHASTGQPIEVPVAFEAGGFPAHMGVYNGTPIEMGAPVGAADNFLCSATWIQDSFALTLASCVQSQSTSNLIVRAGEWNLDKFNSSSLGPDEKGSIREMPIITRHVKHIHTFPGFNGVLSEHNLAILELQEPISYLTNRFVYPACQVQSRSTVRASSCWAPVREVGKEEYFDPTGEGVSKMGKKIKMAELPIKLIANDNNECFAQTKIEFFNYQHPNMFCSGDNRSADRRSKLNQTEYAGSGIYCNEGGTLSLVSIMHPITQTGSLAVPGYQDLSYYKPWIRKIVYGSYK